LKSWSGYGVVSLAERVEELVRAYRGSRLQPLGEVFALQDLLQRGLAHELQDVGRIHPAQPLGVSVHLGGLWVEHEIRLVEVCLGVGVDLVAGEYRSRLRPAARVSNHRGVVADDEDDRVPVVLEGAQHVKYHEVADMQVGGGRVKTQFHPQLVATQQARPEVIGNVNLDRPLLQALEELRAQGRPTGLRVRDRSRSAGRRAAPDGRCPGSAS
jgi:hypothetical protein